MHDCVYENINFMKSVSPYYRVILGHLFWIVLSIANAQESLHSILYLASGDLLPNSTLEQYGTKDVAQSIVERLRQMESNSESKYYDLMNDSEIVMLAPDKFLPLIIQNGFLNQHQTGHSRGALAQERRAKVENNMADLRLEASYDGTAQTLVNELRPKYAYMIIKHPKKKRDRISINGGYGNLVFVFSDSIKTRATFTHGDSVSWNRKAFTFNYMGRIHQMSQNYWEAQIWGSLNINDIKYVLVGCWFNSISLQKDTISILENYGVPVYRCKQDRRSGGPIPDI